MRFILVFLLASALSGCYFVHRIDIQQGNYVTQDVVDRLKTGMTKVEVKQVLGTPLLADTFHQNRWDYYFSNTKSGRVEDDASRLTLFFENERLVSITGKSHPAGASPTISAPDARRPITPPPAK